MQAATKASLGDCSRQDDSVAQQTVTASTPIMVVKGPLSFEDYRTAMVQAGRTGTLLSTAIVALFAICVAFAVQAKFLDRCLIGMLPLGLHLMAHRLFSLRRFRRNYSKESAISLWEISESGIKQTRTNGEWALLPFQRVTRVRRKKGVAILHSSVGECIIPRGAFATENDWESFIFLLHDDNTKLPVRESIPGEVVLHGSINNAEADLMVAINRNGMGGFANGGLLLAAVLLMAVAVVLPTQHLLRGGNVSATFHYAPLCILFLFSGVLLLYFWCRLPTVIRGLLNTCDGWSVSPAGVVVERNEISTGIPWRSLTCRQIRDEGLLLKKSGGTEILFPRSCFSNDDEWHTACAYANQSGNSVSNK